MARRNADIFSAMRVELVARSGMLDQMASKKPDPIELAEKAVAAAGVAKLRAAEHPDGALMALAEAVELMAKAMAAGYGNDRYQRIHNG